MILPQASVWVSPPVPITAVSMQQLLRPMGSTVPTGCMSLFLLPAPRPSVQSLRFALVPLSREDLRCVLDTPLLVWESQLSSDN